MNYLWMALGLLYYMGIPALLTWCVLSYLKVYPTPGIVRRWINNRIRDSRPWRDKCNRFRNNAPTPCWCCPGRCYGANDGTRK